MKELVSIVVPIYNVEKYLNECLQSLITQTYHNIEIILVDDGSTDSSSAIIEEWVSKDERIKAYHKSNGGLSDARNFGIRKATGKYICFVDSDDYVDKDCIKKLYNKMVTNNCDISICNSFYDFENNLILIRYKNKKNNYVMDSEEAILQLNNYKYYDMAAWGKLYKIELFNNIEFPKGKFCEDFYIMYKLFDKAKKIVYFSEPLYFYRQRNGSITKNKNLKYDFIYAAYEQMNYVENKYPKLKNVVRSAYASSAMTVYNMSLKNKVKLNKKQKMYFKNIVKSNYIYIKRNNNIPFIKKVQSFIFTKNLMIYNLTFKLYKLIYKV